MLRRVQVNSPPPHRSRQIATRAAGSYLYLSTGIKGETVTDVSQRLLAQHGGLRGLFCMGNPDLACKHSSLNQPPVRRDPNWSILSARLEHYCGQ